MLMSDVIKVLGNSTLNEFPWGCVVRDTINLFVTNEFKLTETSNATDVTAALGSLEQSSRNLILSASIDESRKCVTQPVGGGMVVEHQSEVEEDNANLVSAMKSPLFLSVSSMVFLIVIISMSMVFSLSDDDNLSWTHLFKLVVGLLTSGA